MGSEWENVTLGDVLTISPEKIELAKVEVENYISTDNMQPYFGGIEPAVKLPSVKKVSKYQEDDILFSNIRTYFKKLWLANKNGGCSNDVIVFQAKEKIIPHFAFYSLMNDSFIQHTVTTSKGTKMPRGDKEAILKYELKLPPLPEQKAIAHILSTLDDKIELNRQMNETLEAMAQALFKSWFVDFDPVLDNAIIAGNDIPDAFAERASIRKQLLSRRPLSGAEGSGVEGSGVEGSELEGSELEGNVSEVSKLTPTTPYSEHFPSEFEFTDELGWIPKGWKLKRADEIAKISIGKTPPRKEKEWFTQDKNNYTWVSIKDMGESGVFIQNSSEYLTSSAIEKFNVKVIPQGSVILSFKLTLGRVCIANQDLTTNEAIAHFVEPNFNIDKEYLYCYLSNFNFSMLGSTSSIATAVNSKIIKAMPFIVPSSSTLNCFKVSTLGLFNKIEAVSEEIESLSKLRDTLLPQLLSGKLRIADAEKMAAELS